MVLACDFICASSYEFTIHGFLATIAYFWYYSMFRINGIR